MQQVRMLQAILQRAQQARMPQVILQRMLQVRILQIRIIVPMEQIMDLIVVDNK